MSIGSTNSPGCVQLAFSEKLLYRAREAPEMSTVSYVQHLNINTPPRIALTLLQRMLSESINLKTSLFGSNSIMCVACVQRKKANRRKQSKSSVPGKGGVNFV